MSLIFSSAGVLALIALILGAFLAVASVVFKVDGDDTAETIASLLPGANCGGCGYAGCASLAKALANGEESVSACSIVSQENADKICDILGIEKPEIIVKKAVVRCRGNCTNTKNKYEYIGIHDCNAAMRVSGGPNACDFGCLGLGSCAAVCPVHAIIIEDGLARVDREKCIGCGACKNACPKKVIDVIPEKYEIIVKCKNTDKGAEVRKYCDVGCIGCKICEKNCPSGAITVNGVAEIDYEKCTACGVCVEKCPKGLIIAGGITPTQSL